MRSVPRRGGWVLVLGLVTLATQACPTPAGGPEPRVRDAGGAQGGSSGQAFVRGDGGGLRLDASASTSGGGTSAWSGGGGSSGQGSSSRPASGASNAGLDAGFHPDAGPPVHPDASTVTTETPQPCTVWQDCGPHYGNLNSGFECVGSMCGCDPAGQWASQCVSSLQGTWVALECLCVVSATSGQPTTDPDPNPSDDVRCWWSWRSNGCEPDRWVDTSHYDRVCNPDCRNVWVNSGYWESGSCTGGRWIKRCDDGTEIWY